MLRLVLVVILILLAGCSNSDSFYSPDRQEPSAALDGMTLVHASGKKVKLGTDEKDALPAVKPSMTAEFTYDFYIGTREVTYEEYGRAMGVSFDETLLKKPVANVTFYDAVLFANALSKKSGLDTVYSYTGAVFDAGGNCVSLLGFSTRFEVDAFRLPTEAEWMLVAQEHWNLACSDTVSSPCDFTGSVKEWVNDWYGGYKDTTYENYAGISGGGPLNTRIVKGGSFKDDASGVHVYDRTDVYPVTADLKMDYIGFRIAYGAVPHPILTDYRGFVVQNDAEVSITSEEFRARFGTMNGKLVFRNEASGNLMYVNFAGGDPVVQEIVDSLEVYHPAISPDGRYVAYSTLPEGVSGLSRIVVRRLEATSRVQKKYMAVSGAIPRWRVLENGDTVIVFVDYSGNNKDEVAFNAAATWQVRFTNESFRNLTKVTDGAYHGGISEDWKLAVTGARALRAKRADEGETLAETDGDEFWYGGEQACNVSLSQDGSKRTLFLDFGGKTGRKFAGQEYGTHEMLLVADSLGKLVQGIPAPSPYSFDNTEWIKRDDMAIATLVDRNGVHRKVVLVDLKDSSVTELAEGSDITYPDLWMGTAIPSKGKGLLSPDSAGVYMLAGGSMEMSLYRYKLELLWRYRDSADVVVLGSSRSLSAVDPLSMKDFYAVNLSQTPNSMALTRDFFERYVLGNVKKLRYLVVSLDIDFWWTNSTDDNFFYERYRLYPGFVYDENHNYWKDDRDARILEYTEAALGSEDADKILFRRGLFATEGNGWSDKPSLLHDSTWNSDNPGLFNENLKILEHVVEVAAENGIEVVGVIFPQNPAYAQTGSYGRYGLRRSEAPELVAQIASLETKYANFHLVDENRMGSHDYEASMSANDDHLTRVGGHVLSLRLDSLLVGLKSK